jgi:hypothetical protein
MVRVKSVVAPNPAAIEEAVNDEAARLEEDDYDVLAVQFVLAPRDNGVEYTAFLVYEELDDDDYDDEE